MPSVSPAPTQHSGALPRLLSGQRRWRLAALIANGVAQGAVAVLAALLLRATFHALTAGVGAAAMLPQTLGLLGVGGAIWALRLREGLDAEQLAQSYLKAVRLSLFEHVNRLPSRVLQRRSRGILMARFVGDLNALGLWAGTGLARALVAVPLLTVVLGALVWTVPAAGAAVAMVFVAGVAAAAPFGPALYRRAREERRRRGSLAASLGEMLTAVSPVQVFGRGNGERQRLATRSDRFAKAAVARATMAAGLRALPAAAAPVAAAVAALTVTLAGGDVWTVAPGAAGNLAALLVLLGLSASPLRDLALAFVHRQSFRAARDVLGAFLALPALPASRDYQPGKGRLEFRRVTVPGALRDVSLVAEPRHVVAVVGPGGSGKSTLLALAARLFDPEGGEIHLDDQVLAVLAPASLRRHLGMVSPDLPLMRASLRRNLCYRRRDASDEEVRAVLQLCGLEADVAAMPAGLATRLSEGGAGLPASLRRRIALARAVLGRPRLLLIDEAEAFADAQSSAALQRVLAARRVTALVAAQDVGHVPGADLVWRLDGNGGATAEDVAPPAGALVTVVPLSRREARES